MAGGGIVPGDFVRPVVPQPNTGASTPPSVPSPPQTPQPKDPPLSPVAPRDPSPTPPTNQDSGQDHSGGKGPDNHKIPDTQGPAQPPGQRGPEHPNNQGDRSSGDQHSDFATSNGHGGQNSNGGGGGQGASALGNGWGGGSSSLHGDTAAAGGSHSSSAFSSSYSGANGNVQSSASSGSYQPSTSSSAQPYGQPQPHGQPQSNGQPNSLPQANPAYQGNSLPAQQSNPYALPQVANANPLPGTGINGGLVRQALSSSVLGAQGASVVPLPGTGSPGPAGGTGGAGGAARSSPAQAQSLVSAQNLPLGASALARPSAASPANSMLQGQANPRAEAAALAAQSRAGGQPGSFSNASQPAALAQMGKAAPATTALPNNAASTPTASMGSAAGAPRASAGNAQAVAQAQGVLAQALGRTMAGQMTAGGAAVALAQAQLALQVALRSGSGRQGQEAAALQAAGKDLGAAPAKAGPQARAQAGMGVRAGVLGPASTDAPGALGHAAGLANKAHGKAANDGQAQAGVATMPPSLAMALAMAPKVRKRGSHDRVERVERDTPRAQTPEMEDEDFWDGLGDADAQDGHDTDPAPEDADSAQALQALQQHYRAMVVWLAANERHALLRELAAGRSVLVLAPPDGSHTRLLGHWLRPDGACASAGAIPGMTGRAWALGAQWSATMPADGQWREWRLRQDVDDAGRWRLGASRPDKHTPRVLVRGDAPSADGPAMHRVLTVGECITFHEPRRLRRLVAAQWTMLVLRVPVPLDGAGQVSAAA